MTTTAQIAATIAELQAQLNEALTEQADLEALTEAQQLAIALHDRKTGLGRFVGIDDWDLEIKDMNGNAGAGWAGKEHQRWVTKAQEVLAITDMNTALKLADVFDNA